MATITQEIINERLELADQLLAGRDKMLEPQDLPGIYGHVVKAIDCVLQVIQCGAVVDGGWAVWRHGFVGRITQDIDIALPADRIDEFMRVASVAGFQVLPQPKGRWPKLLHKDTPVKVDILPEGARPGTASRPAPTTIPGPAAMGAEGPILRYMTLSSLIELKIAAGREKDRADVVELIKTNPDQLEAVRLHLTQVNAAYVESFDKLTKSAGEQQDE
jgi:hypothetical protein